MLPEERRRRIIDILGTEGKVTVPDLAERLDISVDTIRRDLKELETAHQLVRVHGGALPRTPTPVSYTSRQNQNVATKKVLAKQAVRLLQPNQVIFIDGGSTALEVAKNIPFDLEATVVTVCPFVLVTLSQHTRIKAMMLGGTLNRHSMTVVGTATRQAIERIHADIFFLGICSLHHEVGITTHDYDEAQIKALMIENSSQVVAVATSEKLGSVAPFVITTINALTHLITDAAISVEQEKIYTKLGIQLIKSPKTDPI